MLKISFKKLPLNFEYIISRKDLKEAFRNYKKLFIYAEFSGINRSDAHPSKLAQEHNFSKEICKFESYLTESKWFFFIDIVGLRKETVLKDRQKISTEVIIKIKKMINERLKISELSFPHPYIVSINFKRNKDRILFEEWEIKDKYLKRVYQKRRKHYIDTYLVVNIDN